MQQFTPALSAVPYWRAEKSRDVCYGCEEQRKSPGILPVRAKRFRPTLAFGAVKPRAAANSAPADIQRAERQQAPRVVKRLVITGPGPACRVRMAVPTE